MHLGRYPIERAKNTEKGEMAKRLAYLQDLIDAILVGSDVSNDRMSRV